MLKRRGYVIWPIYFDRSASRSICRKVPLGLAVKRPDAERVAKVARRLGWRVEVEEGSHPALWWRRTGKVIVDPGKPLKKSEVLKLLAKQLKSMEH